jgi:NDP-sugar pyrophosphorylase family protein
MSREVKKAMILAAGEGTRLRPLTLETPKVLLPIGGRPLIELQLSWLKHHGIQEVAINLYHLGNKVKDYLGDGSRFGVKISYSPEERLLGTAGGVKRMEHFFDDTFVVFYGDVLTNFDLQAMTQLHQAKKALATLAIFEAPNPREVGIVKMSPEGRILSFVEKTPPPVRSPESPVPSPQSAILASGGVYVLEKEVLNYIPAHNFSDFAYGTFPKLIELNLPIHGYVLKPQDYLIDIGTIEKYRQANDDVEAGRVKIKHGQQSSLSR